MHKLAGILGLAALTACAHAGGPPKAYELAALGRPMSAWPTRATAAARPVVVAPEVTDGFEFLYRFVNETEFVLCLEGKRVGDRVLVTGFRLAHMKSTSVYKVSYSDCGNRDYVGTAHNHPPTVAETSLCYQSDADQRTFLADGRALVDIVLCGTGRFLWVLKDGRSNVESSAQRM